MGMGKVIGGGLPVGAYGGPKKIMELVAPAGAMYQAGTLSGNPLAMTAGIVALGKKHGHAVTGGCAGGMFGWFFNEGPVANFSDAAKSDTDKFGRWHRMMLERGVYLAPSTYEAGFMSLVHTDEDIDKTLAIADEVMAML